MQIQRISITLLFILILSLSACGGAQPEPTGEGGDATPPPVPVTVVPDEQATTVQAEADRDNVFTIGNDQRQQLSAGSSAFLETGQGVDVDENGRAILRFADLLSVEVLRDGALTLQELDINEQSAFVTVLQTGGAVIHNFDPEAEIERRFTVETEFATITATGTEFMIVKEENSPLEWIVGLNAAEQDLWVFADGITKTVVSNQARWVAPFGEPSPGINAKMDDVNAWLNGLQAGQAQPSLGQVVWDPVDAVITMQQMDVAAMQAGQPLEMQGDFNGTVKLTLAEENQFGAAQYTTQDCNKDGLNDLLIENGTVTFDFRNMIGRVSALDATIFNLDEPNSGSLVVYDPAKEPINQVQVTVGPEQGEVLSLRSDQPYHYADLSMRRGCLLGFSFTPPNEPPRPAVDNFQSVNQPPVRFIRIDSPADNASDVVNGFTLSGEASVPFERNLVLFIETPEGQPIDIQPLFVEGGELGGAPGFFKTQVWLDYPLPADIRLRVVEESAKDGSVLAEDSVLLTPLNPVKNDETSARPPENGQATAVSTGDSALRIDGRAEDWQALARTHGDFFSLINALVPEFANAPSCANLYPQGSSGAVDLNGAVGFAYDANYLYALFVVEDDGYVGYSGNDYRYFLGDAPQLLLDLDLSGDFADSGLSADDVQLDFLPGQGRPGENPQAALWNLQNLTVQPLAGAEIAVVPAETGYILEAAIPWRSLGVTPQAGQGIGFVASISDNDTPNTNVQECMISTDPNRNWQAPSSWGTLVFGPS